MIGDKCSFCSFITNYGFDVYCAVEVANFFLVTDENLLRMLEQIELST